MTPPATIKPSLAGPEWTVGRPVASGGSQVAPRLLYVVTEDWYFLSHRLPMARAASKAGFEVHVATHVESGAEAIRREGFVLHPLPFRRGSLSPVAALAAIRALRKIHRQVRPAVCHHVALQAVVFGLLALGRRKTPSVNALTGFGFAFSSGSRKARLLRQGLSRGLRVLLDRPGRVALVQNRDDAAALQAIGVPAQRIATIAGSGVDLDMFPAMPEPEGPIRFGFVGRLLDDKGVRTLVAAQRHLRGNGTVLDITIAGTPDSLNPTSIPENEAQRWNEEPGLHWMGAVTDIAGLWRDTHVAVLPSRREGLPLSLLEAAACGRPMIATDVPGCREIVVHGETGLLVPVDDPEALAAAMRRLAEDAPLRQRLGAAARRRVEEQFSAATIGDQIVALYRRLLDGQQP